MQSYSSAMETEILGSLHAINIDGSSKQSQNVGLFTLPLEIRHRIYGYALINTMYPSPEEIYLTEGVITRLPPASLYFVNRQIHIELRAAFAKMPEIVHLHITTHGALYSSLWETRILAGKSRDITRASKIVITIWPPHPDRPVEIFDIWRSAREIQRQLRQAATPLERLSVRFFDNGLASWCPNGKIIDTIWPDDRLEAKGRERGWNDVMEIAQVFCRLRTASGGFRLAPASGLRIPDEYVHAFPETLELLAWMGEMMRGEDAVPKVYHNEITLADKKKYDDSLIYKAQEAELQREGARIAIEKLEEMTCSGKIKCQSCKDIGVWRFGTHTVKHLLHLFESFHGQDASIGGNSC